MKDIKFFARTPYDYFEIIHPSEGHTADEIVLFDWIAKLKPDAVFFEYGAITMFKIP